jgi:predicted O-methyltransferase YrrM
MLKQEVADKLTELITPMEGQRIVDVGTGWGESAEFFSNLKPDWTIYTIDGFGLYGDGRIYPELEHEKVLQISEKIWDLGNVIQILGNSNTLFWELPIDVLFIDGDHRYDGCMSDYCNFAGFVVKGGLIVFDDYNQPDYPLNGVQQVVSEITSEYFVWQKLRCEIIYEGYYCCILKKL